MQIKSPWLALLLAIIHAFSGLTILLFSSWFIAACAVAGVGFNYMLPAVLIRALALIRISSGYAEMWVGHKHLLWLLAKLRLNLFSKLKNQLTFTTGIESDKLTFQTEAMASIWVGWVSQNASAWLAMAALTIFTVLQLPVFSFAWISFVLVCAVIYFYLVVLGLKAAKQSLAVRQELECDIEHYVNAAPIWHMYQNIEHPKATEYFKMNHQHQDNQEKASLWLLILCFVSVIYLFSVIQESKVFSPIILVLPMAIMAAPDWFGRIFATQTRLMDYITSVKNVKHISDAKPLKRQSCKISTIQVSDFTAQDAQHQPVSFLLEPRSLFLLQGGSGIGKSRLLQALSGLIPYAGKREINGVGLDGTALDGAVLEGVLDDCIYIEQSPYCLSATLRDNLKLANSDATDEKITQVLNQLNLFQLELKDSAHGKANKLDQWIGEKGRKLSGGELKRIGLARAMLTNASFILLDEPFEGLDQDNITNVVNIINTLAQSKGVMVASHIIPEQLQSTSSIQLT
ncbi:ATP-binding cassette domain-containing protein [uncultured Psychrosphaera sp.]|uniref:ATP-binding cassette domain-containing protein n=1 Tax=uncultured Psychrosphaera sp. TaxID=1403522 RepID=UPI0026063A62|nr:ATP-binding cassette domain-containing protein [uncultured Psychrosphaera sp.]